MVDDYNSIVRDEVRGHGTAVSENIHAYTNTVFSVDKNDSRQNDSSCSESIFHEDSTNRRARAATVRASSYSGA